MKSFCFKNIYIFSSVFLFFLFSFFVFFQPSYAQEMESSEGIILKGEQVDTSMSDDSDAVYIIEDDNQEVGEKKGFFVRIFIKIKNFFTKDNQEDTGEEGCAPGISDCAGDFLDVQDNQGGCPEDFDGNCDEGIPGNDEIQEGCVGGVGEACDEGMPEIESEPTDDEATKETKKDKKENSEDKDSFGNSVVSFFLKVFGLEGSVIDSNTEREADCEYAYERILELEDEWDELLYTSKTRDFDVEAEKERILKEFIKFDTMLNENCFEDEIYDSFLVDEAYGGKKEEELSSGEADDVIYIDEKGNIVDEAEIEDDISLDINEQGEVVVTVDGVKDIEDESAKDEEKDDEKEDKVACNMPKKINAITYPFEYQVLDGGHALVTTVYSAYCGVGSKEEFEKIAKEAKDALDNQLFFDVGDSCLPVSVEKLEYVDVKTPGCSYILHSKETEADDLGFDF